MASLKLREREGREPFWEARVSIKGHRARSKSFPFNKKREAKQWADKLEAELRSGEVQSAPPAKTKVADVMAAYVRHHTKKKLGDDGNEITFYTLTPQKRYAMNAVAERLAKYTVDELTSYEVQRFVEETEGMPIPKRDRKHGKAHPLYDGDKDRVYTGSAVRKLYYALKEAMAWHARRHRYQLGDRFEGFKLPKAWTARDRRLHPGEEERLLDACDGMYKDPEGWKLLIRLALATGMRAGELLGLTWEDVNLKERYLVVPDHREKTRKGRTVPLSKEGTAVVQQLKKRRDADAVRVFATLPASTDIMGKGFKRITKRAGSEGLRFHDLRHESIARLFERTPLRTMEIALMTGHSNLSTLQRYSKLRPPYLAEKLDRRGPMVAF